jgi:hypothetical protein
MCHQFKRDSGTYQPWCRASVSATRTSPPPPMHPGSPSPASARRAVMCGGALIDGTWRPGRDVMHHEHAPAYKLRERRGILWQAEVGDLLRARVLISHFLIARRLTLRYPNHDLLLRPEAGALPRGPNSPAEVIDRVVPQKRGGADALGNMQWQPTATPKDKC